MIMHYTSRPSQPRPCAEKCWAAMHEVKVAPITSKIAEASSTAGHL